MNAKPKIMNPKYIEIRKDNRPLIRSLNTIDNLIMWNELCILEHRYTNKRQVTYDFHGHQ